MRLEIRMPKLSEFSDVGAIAKWRVKVGDIVQQGDVLADVEVDLSTVALKARADGKIAEIWVHAGQSVPVATVIAMQTVEGDILNDHDDVAETGEDAQTDAVEADPADEEMPDPFDDGDTDDKSSGKESPVVQHGHVLASPAAILLAEQYNVNLGTLVGTGACGCIEREDVEAAMQTSSQFITVEDVDDLMNFDGDFSSNFSSNEPEIAEMNAPEVEESSAELNIEQDAPVDEASTDVPVSEPDESATEETLETVAPKQDESLIEESSEEFDDAQNEPIVEDFADSFVSESEQKEPISEASLAEVAEDQDAPLIEESEEEVVEVQDNLADEDFADSFTSESEQEEPIADESSAEVAEDQNEPVIEESYESVDEESIDDFVYEQDHLAPEGSSADFVDEHEQLISEELSEEQLAELVGEQVVPDDSSLPDVIYMGEGPDQSADLSSAEMADSGEEAEAMVPEVRVNEADDEPADESIREDETTDEVMPDAEEVVAGPSPEPDNFDEPEALTIDESDTIAAEMLTARNLTAEQEFYGVESADEKREVPAFDTVEDAVGGKGNRKSVKIRRIVARKMQESWKNAPHFFVTVAVDMTDVIRFRTDLGVTINDFILAATSRALQEHHWVNSHFINDEAVEQPEINLSLAVETENGLYYPVLRNCARKSLKELGLAAAAMVLKAHAGKLTDEDMDGGSFTISNMGMLGVESFGAIITPPQVAVLAVGTVKGEVVVDEHEEMVMAPMVRLTLSADHRALDGADAADFLGTLKSYLEAPITLVASQDR